MLEPRKPRTAARPIVPRATRPPEVEHHRFEDYLSKPYLRPFLKILTDHDRGGPCLLEEIFQSYGKPDLTLVERLRFLIPHELVEIFRRRAGVPRETLREKVLQHPPTARALINTARSIAQFGLTTPQRFAAPLLVVWNLTQACNLECKHCYQNATHKPAPDELTWEEKRRVIDEMGENYVPFVAFAGGEPLVSKDIWRALEHCRARQVHTSVATNGTMLTPEICRRLADAGVKYVEVSIDSSHPDEHDAMRGLPGAWKRSIQGLRNVAATPGLRAGMAACFTSQNLHLADEMIEVAKGIGCTTFVHFNFIPVGRGRDIADWDLTPAQREELLITLNRHLQDGKISIMSTAPQFGRACLLYGPADGLMATGHAGSGKGKQARVLSKYIGGCGAGRCYCSVQPNGKVTPCVYLPSIIVGDLRSEPLEKIWRHPLFDLLCDREDRGDHCAVCDFRYYCGGCRARALAYAQDLQAGDPGCVYNTHLWQEIAASTHNGVEDLASSTWSDYLMAGATSGTLARAAAAPEVLAEQLLDALEPLVSPPTKPRR